MADNVIRFSLQGLDQAKAALEALRQDLRRKVVYGALRDCAKPFVKAAQAESPVLAQATKRRSPGTMRRNIKTFASKKYRGQNGILGVYVTVRASRRDLRNAPVTGDPYYWRWVVGGHRIVPRSRRRLGTRAGKALNAITLKNRRSAASGMVKPNPVFERAFRSAQATAIRTFTDRINARINQANLAR